MPEPASSFTLSRRQEWLGVGLILFIFLGISFLVATRTPTVYMDETVFADPPANLYLGSGFTSTMWAQDRDEMFSRQPPLYMGMLYVFFKEFGFGLFQARAANACFTAAAGLLVWAGLRRSGFIRSPGARLLALALVLSGWVSTQTFRTIRYDVGMFLVSALVFFAWCQPGRLRTRYLWAVLASILCPFVGVPMLPFVALMLAIQLAVYRFRNIGLTISVGAGFALGVGLMLLFYAHFGVLQRFLEFVFDVTSAMHRQKPSLKEILFGSPFGEASLITSFFGNPTSFENMKTMFDYSAFFLFVIFLFLAKKFWATADAANRRFIVFILLTTLVLPPIIQLAGHYWADYRWMTYMPLAIAVPRLFELTAGIRFPVLTRQLAYCVAAFSIFLGVPLRSLLAFPDWTARSTTPLERVAARVVRPNDVVICQCKTYFAIRPHAQLVFCTGLSAMGGFDQIKDLPTNDVSLICLFPTNVAQITGIAGGKWKKVDVSNIPEAEALSKSRYAVSFYRRDTNGVSAVTP